MSHFGDPVTRTDSILNTGLHPIRQLLNKLRWEAAERDFCEVR